MKTKHFLIVIASATLLAACGDSSTPPTSDTGPNVDVPQVPDGFGPLRDCTDVGKPCAANTTCAINPVCGTDLKCHPQSYQNCDDGLDCTVDTCLGQGKCENKPKEGTCALAVDDGKGKSVIKCFAKDDPSPDHNCEVCDPDRDKTSWSSANGGSCDDGNDCTKDDYCDNGTCKGTDYRAQCDDSISCTDDVCDGKGGCVGNPLRSDSCLIQGKCYKDGEQDATGCNVCDVKKTQSDWTPLGSFCLIGGQCYKPGDKSTSGCGVCDPAKNDKDWTAIAGVCEIDGVCYQPNDVNTSEGGCGVCDPTVDGRSWTIKGNDCYVGKQCYKPGDKDPVGCGECKPATAKKAWTPIAGCWAIVMAALNEAKSGKLGGVAGADALCAQEASAAGRPGQWKAFLGDSTRTVKSLISGTDATSRKVVTTEGKEMFANWNAMFTGTSGYTTWSFSSLLYTFNGRVIEEDEPKPACTSTNGLGDDPKCFYDADFWTGMNQDGTTATDTCSNWTSELSTASGSVGEADFQELYNSETDACDQTMAVLCVQVGP